MKSNVLRALAKKGLDVRRDNGVYYIKLKSTDYAPEAEVLLSEKAYLDHDALLQLANLAAVKHPSGSQVRKVIATPDFHKGENIAIGSVVATTDMVIPAAVGSDINCGMRFHKTDLSVDDFNNKRSELTGLLKEDYLLGTRDFSFTPRDFGALFSSGLIGFLLSIGHSPRGMLQKSDMNQLERELDQVFSQGSFHGETSCVPENLIDSSREIIRSDDLATIGGGNHFVEIQVVEEVLDSVFAWRLGLKQGKICFMVHSGSRLVGKHIGNQWRILARNRWPEGFKYPESKIFPVFGSDVEEYLHVEAAATNYGFANRMLLAEIMRLRLRQVFGYKYEVPLVYDLPHNITLKEGEMYVARKGACPAYNGQPVIIPGSMGTPSYIAMGLGNDRFLQSASHGAGRNESRFSLVRGGDKRTESQLGLDGVDCITLRPMRRIEEAPVGYKDIDLVLQTQIDAKVVAPVVKLRPLLTFKM